MVTTVTLNPDLVVQNDIQFYDGEWLTVAISRNGTIGDLVMTIDEKAGGLSVAGTEAMLQVEAEGDMFDLSPTATAIFAEAKFYYYNIWRVAGGRTYLVAAGRVSKNNAIRPVFSGGVPTEYVYGDDEVTVITDDADQPLEAA